MDPGDALMAAQKVIVYFSARASSSAVVTEDTQGHWIGSVLACHQEVSEGPVLRAGDPVEFIDDGSSSGTFTSFMDDGASAMVRLHGGDTDVIVAATNLQNQKAKDFARSEAVEWIFADQQVPRGSIGRFVGYNEFMRVRVTYDRGTWNFPPDEVRRKADRGMSDDAVLAAATACSELLGRFLCAAAVVHSSLPSSPTNVPGDSNRQRRMFRAAVRLCLPAETPPFRNHASTSPTSQSPTKALGGEAIREFDAAVGRFRTTGSGVADRATLSIDPESVRQEAERRARNSAVPHDDLPVGDTEAVGLAAALRTVLSKLLRLAGRIARAEAHPKSSASPTPFSEGGRLGTGSRSGGVIEVHHLDKAVTSDRSGQMQQIFPAGIGALVKLPVGARSDETPETPPSCLSEDGEGESQHAESSNKKPQASPVRKRPEKRAIAASALDLATRLYGGGSTKLGEEEVSLPFDHIQSALPLESSNDNADCELGVRALRSLEAQFDTAKKMPSPSKDYRLLKNLKANLTSQRTLNAAIAKIKASLAEAECAEDYDRCLLLQGKLSEMPSTVDEAAAQETARRRQEETTRRKEVELLRASVGPSPASAPPLMYNAATQGTAPRDLRQQGGTVFDLQRHSKVQEDEGSSSLEFEGRVDRPQKELKESSRRTNQRERAFATGASPGIKSREETPVKEPVTGSASETYSIRDKRHALLKTSPYAALLANADPAQAVASATTEVEEVVASLTASPQRRVREQLSFAKPREADIDDEPETTSEGESRKTTPGVVSPQMADAPSEEAAELFQVKFMNKQEEGQSNKLSLEPPNAAHAGLVLNESADDASETRPQYEPIHHTEGGTGILSGVVREADISTGQKPEQQVSVGGPKPSDSTPSASTAVASVLPGTSSQVEFGLVLSSRLDNAPLSAVKSPGTAALMTETELLWQQFERTVESFSSFSKRSVTSTRAKNTTECWQALQSSSDPLHGAAAGLVLRIGIAPSKRRLLWGCWSGGDDLRKCFPSDTYSRCSISTQGMNPLHGGDLDEESVRTIQKDVERTRPDEVLFLDGKGEGSRAVLRILHAFVRRFPNLGGYAQGMSTLAAFIFVTFHQFKTSDHSLLEVEEDSFWTFCALISNFLGGYFADGMEPLLADSTLCQRVHEVHSRRPAVARRLQELDFDWLFVIPDWFVHLFVHSVHDDLALHLWDYVFWQKRSGNSLPQPFEGEEGIDEARSISSKRLRERTFMNASPVLIWVVLGLVERSSEKLEDPAQCRSFQECISHLRASAEALPGLHELSGASMSLHEVRDAVTALRSDTSSRNGGARGQLTQEQAQKGEPQQGQQGRSYPWGGFSRLFERRQNSSSSGRPASDLTT